MSHRVQREYPQLVANVAERIFTVDNPRPKPGFRRIARQELKASGVRLRDLLRDGWAGLKGYG
jgi:electron transfer flavoprotein-quinone oxidoreductase